jgi:hypothetical protein
MRWEPAHKAHAIERVGVLLQLGESISSKLWHSLLSEAAAELPNKGFNVALDEMEFNLSGQVGGAQPAPGPQLNVHFGVGQGGIVVAPGQTVAAAATGRQFQSFSPEKELREIVSLNRNRFIYNSIYYNGWDSFRLRISDLLGRSLDKVLPTVSLSLVKLEYWNRFAFNGPPDDARYQDLLQPGSKHLPSFISSSSELWHAHVGYFISSPLVARKRLVNLNVDVINVAASSDSSSGLAAGSQRRSVGVYSMAQEPVGAEGSLENWEATLSTLGELHTILKDVLVDVINPGMAEQIGLNN